LHFNLKVLNVWIGLCRGVPGLPPDLRLLGYEDAAIERSFQNQAGGTVVPEVIARSEPERHAILVESKSGSNLDEDQLQRYSEVSSQDLVERAFIPPAAAEACDTAIVADDQHVAQLLEALNGCGHAMPLLAVTETGISLKANGFQRNPIGEAFTPELPISWADVPLMYVPIDAESKAWEVADVVIPKAIAHMGQRVPQVGVEQLSQEACQLSWGQIGPTGRSGIQARVREVLKDASTEELSEWLVFDERGSGHVKFQNNPFSAAPRLQTASLGRIQRAQEDFRSRLTQGLPMRLFPNAE
jgi:hypothetical protein